MASRRILLLIAALLLTGCTHEYKVPKHNVVMFDSDGVAVNPAGNVGPDKHMDLVPYPRYTDDEYQAHLDGILDHLKQWNKLGKKKIMIFIHGGMNTQFDSIERVAQEFENGKTRVQLMEDADYYPVFVNWKSSLWSSYFEHLFYIRQGHRWPWYKGWPSSLVIFPVDVTRSLVRAPLVWSMQIYNDATTAGGLMNQFAPSLQDKISTELLCRYNGLDPLDQCTEKLKFQKPPYCGGFFVVEADPPAYRPPTGPVNPDTFPIAVGDDLRRCVEMTGHFASYLVTFPTKLVIGPVLDTFGTSAWENMERRIHLLFHKEEEMDDRNGDSTIIEHAKKTHTLANIEASGGLSVFIKTLKNRMKEDRLKGHPWEIVLVGHSMGTIVINELLRLYGDEDLPVAQIIYLAGAASVRDYEESVWPYLKAHSTTQFYNFTLHPIAERREIQYGLLDLPPRGTLLAWLDEFLADPITLMDRTVGRYDNFVRSMHDTPQELRPRIHFRSFSAGMNVESANPQTHHDAGERFRFWKAGCWAVDARLDQCVKSK